VEMSHAMTILCEPIEADTRIRQPECCATSRISATLNILYRHTGYDANITRSFLEACATACKR